MRWMLGLVAVVAMTGGASAESASVKRGSYLANTIMTCANCHSPKGPPEATNGKDYSGGLEFDEPPFKVTAPNITQDKETGLGKWSAAEIKNVLLTGIRPNGTPLAEIMPTNFYQILTPSDANAIVAYLKTLKPISNKVPNPLYKMALPHHLFPGSEKPMPASAMRNKIKRGFYLATIGHCMECHTPMTQKGRDFGNGLGSGGFEFKGPWGVSKSRNITSSKTKGIGEWSDAEIKRAITQGVSKDGSKLKPPMGYGYYAGMTNSDLDAIVAYLRTVPAKD